MRIMRQLTDLAKDGFSIRTFELRRGDLALSSLRIALKAYFSTYESLHRQLRLAEDATSDEERLEKDFNLFSAYWDACCESIIHFQHFAELVLKELLRRRNELLAVDAGDRPVIFDKLLHGESLAPEDEAGLKSIEASEALKRFQKLIDAGRLDSSASVLLQQPNRSFLETLNGLRNRIWHRGTFVLRYRALDELIGGYAFQFLNQVITMDAYKGLDRIWRYQPLSCGIDPIREICTEIDKPAWNLKKVSLIKEMARAAYSNPLIDSKYFDQDNRETSARGAKQVPERICLIRNRHEDETVGALLLKLKLTQHPERRDEFVDANLPGSSAETRVAVIVDVDDGHEAGETVEIKVMQHGRAGGDVVVWCQVRPEIRHWPTTLQSPARLRVRKHSLEDDEAAP